MSFAIIKAGGKQFRVEKGAKVRVPSLKDEVGVRELHDHLSRYVQHAARGSEVVVTMRGRRVARLAPITDDDPLADLRARGLVLEPQGEWRPGGRPRPHAQVSDLVADQRR